MDVYGLEEKELAAITALQRGIPLSERPFAELGAAAGMSEDDILSLLARLREEGLLRRVGGIFDARRLGWRSVLCAATAHGEALERAAQAACDCPGVTHCYTRVPAGSLPDGEGSPYPNLWFTLAAPAATFERELDALRRGFGGVEILPFPALRRFKIDVVFDLRTRERDETTESAPSPAGEDDGAAVTLPTESDLALIRSMQGSMPLVRDFYAVAAEAAGCPTPDVLARLRAWKERGILRRVALILHHREAGYHANGMCCWDLPPEKVVEAGRRLAAFPEVTHCYERPRSAAFPFRLYAMIHTGDYASTQRLFERLSREAGLDGGELLLSLREYKKTSLVF